MRLAEWINVVYFVFLALVSYRAVRTRPRRRILLLGAGGILLTLLGRSSDLLLDESMSRLLRDWLPAPTLLIAYWQAGAFFTEPEPRLQAWLVSVDDRLASACGRWTSWRDHAGVKAYLETVYMFAYPMVPAGLAVVWLLGTGDTADRFWARVLLPCYACYAALPFAPTLPPRLLAGTAVRSQPTPRSPVRVLNLWILRYFGIGANTFPSGHVAAATATAMLVLEVSPTLGALFSWLALSIAASTVVLRYHYFVDVVLGMVLALGVRTVLDYMFI